MHTIIQVLLTLAQIIAVAALADFVAGVIHWIEDAYFEENTPVIGELFIRPNILHHHLPRHFTRLSWWDSSKDILLGGAVLLGAAWWFHCLTWHVWLFVGLGVNSNQIHKWSHRTRAENGRIISWLQDWHILQTPRHHGLHHTDPKNTYYCPITNFVNPVLERVAFWDRLESVIEKLFGLKHRPDTAVRGQGPGPDWLVQYRRPAVPASAVSASFTVKPTPSSASSWTKKCARNCAKCSAACRTKAKSQDARVGEPSE